MRAHRSAHADSRSSGRGLPLFTVALFLIGPLLLGGIMTQADDSPLVRFQEAESLYAEKSYRAARDLYTELLGLEGADALPAESRGRALAHLASCHEQLRDWNLLTQFLTTYELPSFPWNAHILQTVGRRTASRYGGQEKLDQLDQALRLFDGGGSDYVQQWCEAAFDKIHGLQRNWQHDLQQAEWEAKYGDPGTDEDGNAREPEVPWPVWQARRGKEIDQQRRDDVLALYSQIINRSDSTSHAREAEIVGRALLERGMFRIHSYGTTGTDLYRTPKIEDLIGRLEEASAREHAAEWLAAVERALEDWRTLLRRAPNDGRADDACFLIAYATQNYLLDLVGAIPRFQELIDRYPESQWAEAAAGSIAKIRREVVTVAAPPHFPTGTAPLLSVDARNVERVTCRLYPIDEPLSLLERSTKSLAIPADADHISWSVATGCGDDHKQSRFEVVVPEERPGAYLLRITGKERESETVVLISDLAMTTHTGVQETVAWVTDTRTGHPRPNAEVMFRLDTRHGRERTFKTHTVKTDAEGVARWPFPQGFRPAELGRSVRVTTAAQLGGHVTLGGSSSQWANSNRKPRWVPYVESDRPAYRPGQTAHFKVTARHWNGTGYDPAKAGETFEVKVKDPRDQTIFEQIMTTDANGALAADTKLSMECPLGVYRLELHHAGEGGSKRLDNSMLFRVEEYRLPEFEVAIEAPEEALLIGDPLRVTVSGRFLAGDPLRSGEVRIKVTRSPLHFQVAKRHRYPWFHPRNEHHYWNQEEVYSAKATLDASGNAVFDIPTAEFPDKSDSTYHVSAWITDDAEREETATQPLPITHQEFFVHLDPKIEVYSAGERLQLDVQTVKANQGPIASSGEIEIARRKDQVENTEEGPVTRTRWEPVFTAPLSVGLEAKRFEEVVDEAGQFQITYRTRDRRDNVIEGSVKIWVMKPTFTARDYRLDGVHILTSATEYKIGDTVRGAIVCAAADAEVLLLRSGGGVFVDVTTVRARGHIAQFEFPASAADAPNFFLTAIVVRDGKYHRAQRSVLVPPEHVYLEGELTTTDAEVRPGSEVALQLHVRDHQGRPVHGAFSLTLYDEAIHSIQPEFRPSTLEHFYGMKWDFDLRHVYSTRFHAPTRGRWLGAEPRKYRTPRLPSGFRPWHYQFPYLSQFVAGAFAPPGGSWDVPRETGAAAPRSAMKLEAKSKSRRGRGAAMGNDGALFDSEEAADSVKDLSFGAPEQSLQGDAGGAEAGAGGEKPRLRSRFDETAVWRSDFRTDETGRGSVQVTMPDSLTRWVGIARGITPDGRVLEARMTMRTAQRILARLATPRFFRERDEVAVAALVRSRYGEALSGSVRLQFPSDILEPLPASHEGQRDGDALTYAVSIPANGEVRIDVPFKVIGTGEAVLTLVATTPREGDALERKLPALHYGLDRKITGSGVVLSVEGPTHGEWDFTVPEESVAATRLVQVNCTASPAIALIESLPYLVRYPYGCVEQTLHRFVPAAVVAQTLRSTGVRLDEILPEKAAERPEGYWGHLAERPLELFRPGDLQKLLAAGDARLQAAQNADGSWGWWAGVPGDPYITALVVDAYATAIGAGVDLPRDRMTRGAQWLLTHLDSRDLAGESQIYDRPDFEELAMVGRAIFRAHQIQGGSAETTAALTRLADLLYGFRSHLGGQGKALLAVGIAALEIEGDRRPQVLLRNLQDHETRKPKWGTTHYGQRRDYAWWYDSGVETTARALEAFLAIAPDDPRVREMVRWLLENRQGSHYDSTKSTAAVAFALAGYLQKSGELQADMTVDVLLDGNQVGTFQIRREELFTRRHTLQVHSSALFAGAHRLELRRRGEGELYWDATLSFYSQEDPIPAGGHRLAVERRYYQLVDTPSEREETYYEGGLERKRIVPTTLRAKQLLVDGARLAPGDRVLVEVEVESPQRFRYLMFTDHKPAGLEAVAVRSGYIGGVFSYRELRDDRVLHFSSRLPEGTTTFSYELRAERPGFFRALPTTAEAMYLPHIHANSAGAAITIDLK